MIDVNKRVNTDRNIGSLLFSFNYHKGKHKLLCQRAEGQQITAQYVNGLIYHSTNMPATDKLSFLFFIYLNINQLDAQNFIMILFHASTCGIITPTGGRHVHSPLSTCARDHHL